MLLDARDAIVQDAEALVHVRAEAIDLGGYTAQVLFDCGQPRGQLAELMLHSGDLLPERFAGRGTGTPQSSR